MAYGFDAPETPVVNEDRVSTTFTHNVLDDKGYNRTKYVEMTIHGDKPLIDMLDQIVQFLQAIGYTYVDSLTAYTDGGNEFSSDQFLHEPEPVVEEEVSDKTEYAYYAKCQDTGEVFPLNKVF